MTGSDERDTIFAVFERRAARGDRGYQAERPGCQYGLDDPRRAVAETASSHASRASVNNGDLLDRALLLWFPAPGSATGEDVAELHVHGGRAVVAAVLAALASLPGCRRASPGEFTRRALANGRIDLAQAEALGDLLMAETESQRRQAVRGAEGALGRQVAGWRARLVHLAVEIEAELDFADEGDVASRLRNPGFDLLPIADEIADLLKSPPAERLRDGVRIVIAGPPNSGKSSLLNALAGRDAAIVSEIAGTTRDRIELAVALDGMPVLLTDTAGLRDSDDPVERIGIARAVDAIAGADVVLWLGLPEDAPFAGASRLILHARADMPGREALPDGADLSVSIFGEGLKHLRAALATKIAALLPADGQIAVHRHQRHGLRLCEAAIRSAAEHKPLECTAEELRRALDALDLVNGGADHEELLDLIFARFCVGK